MMKKDCSSALCAARTDKVTPWAPSRSQKDIYFPKVQTAPDPLLAAADEPKEQILAASSQVEL